MRNSLADAPSSAAAPLTNGVAEDAQDQYYYQEEETYDEAAGWEHDANEIVFDDTGEGAGIEGDLDVDDD